MDSKDVRARLQRGLDGVISFHLDAEMEDEDDMPTRQALAFGMLSWVDCHVKRGAENMERNGRIGSGELCIS